MPNAGRSTGQQVDLPIAFVEARGDQVGYGELVMTAHRIRMVRAFSHEPHAPRKSYLGCRAFLDIQESLPVSLSFAKSDKDGKFVVERLIPGQKHSVLIKAAGASEAKAVTDALVPQSGETSDLGVIRLSK